VSVGSTCRTPRRNDLGGLDADDNRAVVQIPSPAISTLRTTPSRRLRGARWPGTRLSLRVS